MSSQRKKSRRQPEPGSGGRGPGRRRSKSADPLPVSSEVKTNNRVDQQSLNMSFFKEKNSEKGGNSNNEKLLVSKY